MGNISIKYLRDQAKAGRVGGFFVSTKKPKKYSTNPAKNIPVPKSKAVLWLDFNLQMWSNEHALTLEMEYKFCPDRGWRWDYCWPAIKVAIEYNGGIFMQKSGHSNMKGLHRDSEKMNRAQLMGWRVLTVTAMNYTTILKTLNELKK